MSTEITSSSSVSSFSGTRNNDWSNRRIGVSVPHILRQKDGNENQKNPDPIRGNIAVKANKSQSPSSEMPILDDPSSTENLDGNWVRTILQEKERQLNNNNGCDLHEKCISTQKLKGMLECPVCHSTPSRKVMIHQCNNGHILCQKCRHPNQITCPYLHCQSPLNVASSNRNLLCEKIMTLLPLECSFFEHGCQASAINDTAQLLLHEKKCPHRLIVYILLSLFM